MIMKIILYIIAILFLVYLLLPNFGFPNPIPESLQSNEPADQETPFRRAYFTDMSRSEVIRYYKNEIESQKILSFRIPSILLNYPPEEAQLRIRDQTRSSYLQEVVFPLRESYYINGFEPKEDKDAIFVNGKTWRQKVTIRYVSSRRIYRVFLWIAVVIVVRILWQMATSTIYDTKQALKRNYLYKDPLK